MNHFAVLITLLRDRKTFLDEIRQGIKIDRKIVSLLISSSAFFAVYGAIIGASSSWMQMLASAIKLPALYLMTLVICLPTLYFFDILFGSALGFSQYAALILTTVSVISVLLFSFAPVTLFFLISIHDYDFFLFVNILIFALTGLVGIKLFYQGMKWIREPFDEPQNTRQRLLQSWLILYGLVGSQLGWTLRPFFGAPTEPFQLFRQIEGNFYTQAIRIIFNVFGIH